MKVRCMVEYTILENEDGQEIDSVIVECDHCGLCQESYGTTEASIRRCLALLREECPESESNFYYVE